MIEMVDLFLRENFCNQLPGGEIVDPLLFAGSIGQLKHRCGFHRLGTGCNRDTPLVNACSGCANA